MAAYLRPRASDMSLKNKINVGLTAVGKSKFQMNALIKDNSNKNLSVTNFRSRTKSKLHKKINTMPKFSIFTPFVLAACGVESSNTSSTKPGIFPEENSQNTDTNSSDISIYRESYNYYEYVYDALGSITQKKMFGSYEIFFSDLNNDGDLEVISQIMRGPNQIGDNLEEPTEEYLLVMDFVGSDGYININNEILSQVSLGGVSRRHAVGDLNDDGIQDFAFAMSFEDGRSASDIESILALPSVLLSSKDNKFTVENFGFLDWGHSVEIFPNYFGYNDVLFGGYVSGSEEYRGLQAYRYMDDRWVDVTSLYPIDPELKWANSIRHLETAVDGEVQDFLAVTATRDTNENGYYEVLEEGLKFYGLNQHGEWDLAGEYWLKLSETIAMIGWNGDPQTVQIGEFDGNYLVYPTFHEIVSVTNSNGKNYFIAKLGGMELSDGEILASDKIYNEGGSEFSSSNTLLFFEVEKNGRVELIESLILDEVTNINYNFFSVEDINGDDLKDIVVSAYSRPGFNELVDSGGHPIVYLGNEEGKFERKDISYLPKHSSYEDGDGLELYGTMKDINADGYFDLILTGTSEAAVEVIFLNDFI